MNGEGAPGADEIRKQLPILGDEWFKYVPLSRIGDAEDIAEVVALLAFERRKIRDRFNYCVDGGVTALTDQASR